MADIQGFEAVVELDGNTITLYCNDASVDRKKSVQAKATMDGTGTPQKLVTQKDGSLSLNGQVDTVGHELLEASFAKDVPVSFKLTVGDGVVIHAGDYSGEVVLDGSTVSTAADGTWDFTLSADGWLAYTPPV